LTGFARKRQLMPDDLFAWADGATLRDVQAWIDANA
jgi:hypothetical protein